MSYCCDRERSVTFGIEGGLPGYPTAPGSIGQAGGKFLGAIFSGLPVKEGDEFDRPSSGGGGFGDPLERDPAQVLEDVIDDYVSVERARKDYGVVIKPSTPSNLHTRSTSRPPQRERGNPGQPSRLARRGPGIWRPATAPANWICSTLSAATG